MKKTTWLVSPFLALALIVGMYNIFSAEWSENTSGLDLPLSGQVIVIDPGHGGIDGGSSSREGLMEDDVALEISFKLRDYLQSAGALVLMTREEDVDLADTSTEGLRNRKVEDLQKRVQLINESGSDFFISLHLNAGSSDWRGAQTFYNPAFTESQKMAETVQGELTRQLENTNRKAAGVNNIFMLDSTEIPGLLIEAGFLSNPDEAGRFEDEEYLDQMAASIYQGLARHADTERRFD
ncbi:N-acetylmuramoyl-L-alanine amidase CwlD [Salicibibacter halophilus]|uniref:N-acetylmuramoyl-L-alanine amidase CwlD n=1 Tax=Salicibibacter halophilus TaxID=2502791 RepID=A0A514LJK3_9BACI|nr:N-acetylmuramoyl-L-alanine amidase CwlD [Salicibibacter halophilus]QDI91471.1 N-acetylmuramoyl-L-alanine amidase CwlD [Salicibibacter halophilus]